MTLSRKGIARTGLRLLNEVGLGGLTLRLIARELGVKAPALYWYVASKQELLDEMATLMYEDAFDHQTTLDDQLGWEESLARTAQKLRRAMLDYRDGAKVFSGTFSMGAVGPVESLLHKLLDAGFSPRRAGNALITVYSYVSGFTIEEQAVHPFPDERDERYDRLLDDYGRTDPEVAEAVAEMFGLRERDERFATGLRTVLTGIRADVAESPQRTSQ